MLKCKICGCEFNAIADKHYISRDKGKSGIATIVSGMEGGIYDTFDCPQCGCQYIAQERKRVLGLDITASQENEEADEGTE